MKIYEKEVRLRLTDASTFSDFLIFGYSHLTATNGRDALTFMTISFDNDYFFPK